MHLLWHNIEIFEKNLDSAKKPEMNSTKIYRCNMNFMNKQIILNAPVAQKLIRKEKSMLQGTEENQECIMYYDAVIELPQDRQYQKEMSGLPKLQLD